MSSGEVSRRTRMHGSDRAALACASVAENTSRPVAAPGLAAGAHQRGMGFKLGKTLGHQLFQGRTARVAGDKDAFGLRAQRVAALALPQVASGDLLEPGFGIDQLQHARATFAAPDAQCHLLHHQPQPRIGWCALGHAQQTGRGALPRAGHGFQNAGQLGTDVFGKRLFGLLFIGGQRRVQRRGVLAVDGVEHVRVQTCDVHGIALHEPQENLGRRLGAQRLAQFGVAVVVHADVQHRAGPAPIGVLRRRAHTQQRAGRECGKDAGNVRQMPRGDVVHRAKAQRHGRGHRQVQPHQPLQTLCPTAVGFSGDRGGLRDQRRVGVILHCGTF